MSKCLKSKRHVRRYGWKPSLPDHRDVVHAPKKLGKLPAAVAPLTGAISAYDQGQLGSCTGNGCGRVWQHRMMAEGKPSPVPSRLFIYYGERAIEGTIDYDNGAEVRDGLKVLANCGACPETDWPYDIRKFAVKPPQSAYDDAIQHNALQYQSVPVDLITIKTALANGNPIVMGFTVFESFESEEVANTGVMPMPDKSESIVGGHCVVIDGYDDATQRFWLANSWGQDWGQHGWFTMPYENLVNCDDFWVLLSVK